MVKINGYELDIIATSANNFNKNSFDYVSLQHKAEYKVKLVNTKSTNCDVQLYIDNDHIGTWRLKPYQTATIERPANVSRKFTFLKETSSEASSTGIVAGSNNNGLVKAIFTPEKAYDYTLYNECMMDSCNSSFESLPKKKSMLQSNFCNTDMLYRNGLEKAPSLDSYSSTNSVSERQLYRSGSVKPQSMSAGATSLGAHSGQTFTTVGALTSIDTANITTLNLRLVVDDSWESAYVPLKSASLSNPEPPRFY
jgi:hypothetical protein